MDRKAAPQSQCPRCRSRRVALQGLWDGAAPAGDKASALWQRAHPAHGVWLALRAATWGVKLLAAKVYRCAGCGHVWRVWLPKSGLRRTGKSGLQRFGIS